VVHELAATQSLLQIALDAAARAGATRVLAIDVVIGELTSMVDDSVQFYFDALSGDTPAAGARLNFRREPAVASCSACGHQAPVRPPLSPTCGACGAHALTVAGGQAFYVDSIEVDHESAGGDAGPQGE
jgi:hydrogenase nickel incorporation protein HypA/HybF